MELLLDVGITHPIGVQGDDYGFNPLGKAFSLGYDGRLEAAVPVTGNVYASSTEASLIILLPYPLRALERPVWACLS